MSSICSCVGTVCVTGFITSALSVAVLRSCTKNPPKHERTCFSGNANCFCTSIMRFFLWHRISTASDAKEGAITTSQNSLSISSAVCESISRLAMSTPPNADTGSHARASLYAWAIVSREATPQALLCFSMAKVGSASNSEMSSTAAATSKRLLYESSLPCNCSNISSRRP